VQFSIFVSHARHRKLANPASIALIVGRAAYLAKGKSLEAYMDAEIVVALAAVARIENLRESFK
jgi:hypothetical protein